MAGQDPPYRNLAMATIEVKVPDIGGYDDVPVIELLVKVGDTVKQDQGLVTLESDKATMEVPASAAGVVRELKVKLGDKLSQGSVVAVIETEAAAAVPSPPAGEGQARAAGQGEDAAPASHAASAPPAAPSTPSPPKAAAVRAPQPASS